MRERKFKLCGVLKKSDCIDLIKSNLSFDELKTLINPNFNQLIRILNCMNKKELQYIVFNTEKLSIDKITTTIQKTAMEEQNTINKNFLTNDNDSEEDDLTDEAILHEENIEVKKLPAENHTQIIPFENNLLTEINSVENIEVKKLPAENHTQKLLNKNNLLTENNAESNLTKKVIIQEPIRELNEVSINMENIPTSEAINLNKPNLKKVIDLTKNNLNMERLDKCYNLKKVKEILLKVNYTEEEMTDYLKSNAMKIVEKMKNHKEYGKHFINQSADNYKAIYELMEIIKQ